MDRRAPTSAGTLVLEGIGAAPPVSRHAGPRAEAAYLRARIEERRGAGDTDGERAAAITLARLLVSRGVELDNAIALARQALALGDDPALRAELGGWFAGLGEPAMAAAAIRGTCDSQRPSAMARTLVKIAVLLARATDVAGAVDALEDAARLDPSDAMASELLGTISAWATDDVFPESAAEAYLTAAERREAASEREAAFEDRLRAFEIAPHDTAAADAMAAALEARGRQGAPDEALRAHAAALMEHNDVEGAIAVHVRRLVAAVKDGDAARAVGCAFDASLEADVDGIDAPEIDEVMAQAGLYELVAARQELAAERLVGSQRSAAYEALARLYAGPLASPDRAVEAWIEALACDPSNAAARAALRDHAATLHDLWPLVEALIRIGEDPLNMGPDVLAQADPAERLGALQELAAVAEDKLADPALALWAVERQAEAGREDAAETAQRLTARLRAQDEALAAAQRALRGADTDEGRVDALRRLVVIYRGRPAERDAYEQALAALARVQPADRSCLLSLDRLSRRTRNGEVLAGVLAERLAEAAEAAEAARETEAAGDPARATSLTRVELVRTRLLMSAIHRRLGDEEQALEDILPLLNEAPGHRGAASAALLLATRLGRTRERADALVQLAGPVWPALRAVLLALGAELYAAADDGPAARRTAQLACETDPSCGRAVATLGAVVSPLAGNTDVDRATAAAIERAITTVLPRGALCDGLARTLEALGELGLSLAWTQRWLALRPGCPHATRALIGRATAARDAARLSDALAWVLAQPKPIGDMAPILADSLDALLDLDPARAVALARRALDVFGPQIPLLRERLLDLAQQAADPQLAVTVLERWRAAEPTAPHATELLLLLVDCRVEAGDLDGAARDLARAAAAEGDVDEIVTRLQRFDTLLREARTALGSDGAVALAEARARALSPRDGVAEAAANAWRELGSLLWDLAEDRDGAEAAFYRASELSPAGGLERYARDLRDFAGVNVAIETLIGRAGVRPDRTQTAALNEGSDVDGRRRAGLLIEAASMASDQGLPARALEAAVAALEIDASRSDAVAIVEKCAHVEGGVAVLDRMYRLLATAAMGCYGRRAAHYRAARQLERRGALDLALVHAIACFEAVPAEGTTYVLLARLAERAGDPSEAVRALERVAASGDADYRNTWLKRAAALAGKSEEGLRLRVDILLRALLVRADPQTVQDVGAALADIINRSGELVATQSPDAEIEALRFERAVNATLPKLDGPDGARAAIEMARIAIRVLNLPALALTAIERAMRVDGDIDEFDTLGDLVTSLVREQARASHLIAAIYAAAKKPHASVGPALLRWASKLAEALSAPPVAAALLVEAARRAPEDDELAFEADVSVQVLGDDELKRSLDNALPVARRIEALLHLADKHEREGAGEQAAQALERALATDELHGEARDRVVARFRRLLEAAGRTDDLEALLSGEIARADLPDAPRRKMARELASLRSARGAAKAAVDAVAGAAMRLPFDADLLADVQRLAREAGTMRPYVDVLTRLAGLPSTDAERLVILRQLAPLVQELGDRAAAAAHYEAIARLDPKDTGALAALAAILARRVAAAPSPETQRALRLRRAAVLEQRLGLLDEACAELEALLEASPHDVSALRFLADIHERLGAPLRASPLWRRLGHLASGAEEKVDYALRACKNCLDGGDLDAAGEILDGVEALAPPDVILELRVDLARRRGDARALADALDQLASSTDQTPARRVELLVEAARATSLLGQDSAALERARRAVQLAPDAPAAVLEARRLEVRLRGTGTPRDAQTAVDDLNRIAPHLRPEHIELHAFLLAESLDVILGHGAGMRELTRRHAEIGPATLIALGMAERLALKRNFEAAVPLFERALGGDLQGMRARGRVALAAAQAAQSAGDLDTAARLLEEAAAEPETRTLAVRRQLELTVARGDPEAARRALEILAAQSTGIDRGRALIQLARLLAISEPDEARRMASEALDLASDDRTLTNQVHEVRAHIEAMSVPTPETLSSAKLAPAPEAAPPLQSPQSPPQSPPPPAPSPPRSPPPPAQASSPPAVAALAPPSPLPPPLPSRSEPRRPERRSDPAPPVALPRPAAVPRVNPAVGRSPAPREPRDAPRSNRGLELDFGELSDLLDDAATPTPIAPVAAQPEDLLEAPRPEPDEPAADSAPPPNFYPPASIARLLSSPPPPNASDEEAALFRRLAAGTYDAGDRLIQLFADCGEDRAREALAVRRMQAALCLGDRGALQRLQDAALADQNLVYARAVEHVLRAFDPAPIGATVGQGPIVPPPLSAQRDAPDLVNALLFRDLEADVNAALAIVWDTGLFRRDAAQYGLTGVERIQPGPATVVAEVYGAVGGRLGFLRTALFHHRAPTPLEAQVVPLLPPAVMLRGEAREETAELRFLLGAHLAGSMPEHVLVNALPPDELRTLLAAVVAAFGPLDSARNMRGNPAVVRLEQNLWQLIPPRCERKLREICGDAEKITYEAALRTTRAAMRRAGLYAAGDVATAVRAVIKEADIKLQVPLSAPDGLAAACNKHPEIADVVRMATRMEYAEARWQPGPVTSLRRMDTLRPRYRAG